MARFRGTVQGGRGSVSRLGHTATGMVTVTNGWDSGVKVEAVAGEGFADEFRVYKTSGLNNREGDALLITINGDRITLWKDIPRVGDEDVQDL